MRRTLLKMAFAVAVFVLTVLLVAPVMVGLQAVLVMRPGASGHYQGSGEGGLLLAIVVLVICATISDRFVSYLFWAGGLSDGRWTVLKDRPREGKMN
jgi:hypothetical protein